MEVGENQLADRRDFLDTAMKVVMLGSFGLYPKGTISYRAVPLAKALANLGHQVTVITVPWDNPADSGRMAIAGGVDIINIKLPPRLPIVWYWHATYRLLRQALALNPEVVHVFKPKAFAGLAAFLLWWARRMHLLNLKLVVDSDDWEGQGGWNKVADYSWPFRLFFTWQEKWLLRHADGITVASRTLEDMVKALDIAENRVFYLPNGWSEVVSPLSSINTPAINLGSIPKVLLYTRFFEYDLERLIKVWKCVLDDMPEARLLVVGKGLFGEEERLSKLAKEAGIADSLIFTGWIEPQLLGSYLAAADVAIYPMNDDLLNRAKCPLKLIDLLSAGLPVVAEGVGQVKEYVQHQETGILVEPGDVQGFAAEVKRLLRDKALRDRLGHRAKAKMKVEYDWNRLAQTVHQVYLS